MATQNKIYNKVNDILHERYGSSVPFVITNRLMTERSETENTDIIVYLDFLSALVSDAKGYPIADLIAHRDDVFNYIQEKKY